MWKKSKEKLKNIDAFWYQPPVDVHRTLCGGLTTIIFTICLLSNIGYCIYKSISHKYDSITILESNNNLEKMGQIRYKDLNFMIFH